MDWYSEVLVTRQDLRDWGARKPDPQLDLVIMAVSRKVQAFLGRPLVQYKRLAVPSTTPMDHELEPEQVAGNGQSWLRLTHYPITEVEEVQIGGQVDESWTLHVDMARRGYVYRADLWPQSFECSGDLDRGLLSSDRRDIQFSYTGGYTLAEMPAEVKLVVIRESLQALAGDGRSHSSLIEEETPGGWRQKWASGGGKGPSGLSPESESEIYHLARVC